MFELKDVEMVREDGEVFSLSFVPSEKNNNVNGTIHGGVLFLFCDEAVGRYVTTVLGRVGAAADANVHYYRPGKAGEKLIASVTERKVGKRLGTFLVELKDENGVLLADTVFTISFKE